MYPNIFLYKFLISLNIIGIHEINISDLKKFHTHLILILQEYRLESYANVFKKENKFLMNILQIFGKLELGVYIKGILYFYESPLIIDSLINYQIDISDNLINEIVLHYSLHIKEINNNIKK